jgi:hypothetical protein
MKRIRVAQEYLKRLYKSSLLILGVIFLHLVSFNSNAQTFETGVFGGAAYYLGDLNPGNHFIESNIAYGGVLKYNFNKRLTLGVALTKTSIESSADTYNANHVSQDDLSTNITDLALLGEINFFPYYIGERKNFWTPYVFGGGAAFLTVNKIEPSLPFGVGIKLSPFENIGLNLFWSARKTFTDDIDNVISIDYQGYNDDWYIFYGLNITFAIHLRKDTDCRNLNGR